MAQGFICARNSMVKVGIIDYGLANIRSVVNAVLCFNVETLIIDTGEDLKKVDKIILPGVGSFDAGMRGLQKRGHVEAIKDLVLEQGKPFLGICLGLQFLFQGSEEGNEQGLGWFPGTCRRFPAGSANLKVPHMGWSDIEVVMPASRFLAELRPPLTFYFVHSYYAPVGGFTAASCHYGLEFTAVLEHENIFATQFHPEKSQLAGMKLLETFLEGL